MWVIVACCVLADVIIFLTSISPFFTEGVSVVYLGFLVETSISASVFSFINPRKLTRGKLLMKHTSSILLT